MKPFISKAIAFVLLAPFSVTLAQTASSTSDAGPTETASEGTTSQPQVTPTDTITGGADSSTTSSSATATGGSSGGDTTTSVPSYGTTPPDVLLKVPELHVGRIELDVDNLNAEINLAAQIANLVELNAGIQVGITKVNITIADVNANLDLIIRLGNLADIVNRTLESLNLNPLLINVLNEATDLVDVVVGAVDGLLGSIVNGDSKINFLIDNLGNIVQEVEGTAGKLLSTIVGNFEQNMTYTGAQEILDGGLIQKTYKYDPLSALVNIVFNAAGQVVQAVVLKGNGGSGGSSTSTTTAAPTGGARR
ncbi:hypothetical protein F5Y00DRAFT_264971 [Daldinia vernicosa]|uniref:uncharacterized protein n=1 Tax=Daldinia vernicosa TaxID=114800 RepID=UPI002008284F|nr:uncharacterized protein F5Y00DRAFT_264971 [Daldinia vernicosa]KAI0846078.1 hypothetical protein F5Y00DRAFT_264971 [Daldinia vernicosa]